MERIDELRAAAEDAAGLRYDSAEARAILDRTGSDGHTLDWQDYYPEVDPDGLVTGTIIDADAEGYANVDDLAMVSLDGLSAALIRANGARAAIRESGRISL